MGECRTSIEVNSMRFVIWKDAFGVTQIYDGEMYKSLAIFVIAAVIWFIPFAVI